MCSEGYTNRKEDESTRPISQASFVVERMASDRVPHSRLTFTHV
jgi:hypothetical protein